jgi:hypothetical protein
VSTSNGKQADGRLNFGVFITPFHPVGQSPTHALQYDMDRVEALDASGSTRPGSGSITPADTS